MITSRMIAQPQNCIVFTYNGATVTGYELTKDCFKLIVHVNVFLNFEIVSKLFQRNALVQLCVHKFIQKGHAHDTKDRRKQRMSLVKICSNFQVSR